MVEYLYRDRPNFDVVIASAKGVADRFAKQYSDGRFPAHQQKIAALVALGDKAEPDDVAEVIGNKSWTHAQCISCRNYVARAIEFDGGDSPCQVCADCLRAALDALTSTERAP